MCGAIENEEAMREKAQRRVKRKTVARSGWKNWEQEQLYRGGGELKAVTALERPPQCVSSAENTWVSSVTRLG